jgi:hypothetical protein
MLMHDLEDVVLELVEVDTSVHARQGVHSDGADVALVVERLERPYDANVFVLAAGEAIQCTASVRELKAHSTPSVAPVSSSDVSSH